MDKEILNHIRYYLGFVEKFHSLHYDEGGIFCFPRSFENIAFNTSRYTKKLPQFIEQNLDNFDNKDYEIKEIRPLDYVPTKKGYWHKYCRENSEKSLYPKEKTAKVILKHFKEYKPDCEKIFVEIIQNIKNIKDLFYFSEILHSIDNNYNSIPFLLSTTFLGENKNLLDIFDSFSEDKPIRDKIKNSYDLSELNSKSYDWFKKNLPNDSKSYLLLIQHHFSSTRCSRGHIIFFHPDLVNFIYTKLIKMNINKIISESYSILRKSFENTHLMPLYNYRNRQYLFLYNLFENYWGNLKPFYKEDIEDFNNEFLDLQNLNFLVINSEGEIRLKQETVEHLGHQYYQQDSRFYNFYNRIKEREDSRISRNINKFLKFWFRTPVKYNDGCFTYDMIENIGGDKNNEKKPSKNSLNSEDLLSNDSSENIQKNQTLNPINKSITSEFNPKEVKITRGGDWKVEGNQSIFYFKVKIKNDSNYIITNIHILLTSIPSGLEVNRDKCSIKIRAPHSSESPLFKFVAKESCVGDFINGLVTYSDYLNNPHTITIEPFRIKYVCNLIVPKPISKQEFDQNTEFMDEKKLTIESNLEISELESIIEPIIRKCNFALLQDLQTLKNDEFKKFEAYAQGLYDKQDVALTIAVKKIDNGSRLMVKTMSNQSDKVTDILKDFNIKLDDIKSDIQLIKEYSGQIEQILGKVDNLENFLKDKLTSDFERIRHIWEDYSVGNIKRRDLIKECIIILGRKFIRLVISNMTFLG